MENLDSNTNANNSQVNKGFLITLCVLSFVYIGWSLISELLSFSTGRFNAEQMDYQRIEIMKNIHQMQELKMDFFEATFRNLLHLMEAVNNNFYLFHTLSLIFLLIGLVGVIFLLRRKKLGFHLYIIYSLLMSSIFYFVAAPQFVPGLVLGWNLFISGLFVLLYWLNVKRFNN